MAKDEEFSPTAFGIFAGCEGLEYVSTMQTSQDKDGKGLLMQRTCEGCGSTIGLLVPWSEMYCLRYNLDPAKVGQMLNRPDVFPTTWSYLPKKGCYHPNHRCGCHGNPVVLFHLTPQMANRALEEAGNNGNIHEQEQAIIRFIGPTVKRISQQIRGGEMQQPMQQPQQMGQPQYPNDPRLPPGYRR